jgi:elongation factor P--beta-lysine ligase
MAGGVAQGVGPEFKPQYHTKKRLAMVGTEIIAIGRIFRN